MRLRGPAAILAALLALATTRAGASPPYVLDDGDVEPVGHVEIDLGPLATTGSGGTSGDLTYLEADLGVRPGLETDLSGAAAFAQAGPQPRAQRVHIGFGDLELQEKLRVVDQDQAPGWPSVALDPTLTVPTGSARRGLGTGHAQLLLPVWASRDFGPWILFGGGGWIVSPGAEERSHLLAGAGAAKQFGSWHLGGELYETTRAAADAPALLSADLDVVRDLSAAVHVFLSVGHGFGAGAGTDRLSGFAGVQLTR